MTISSVSMPLDDIIKHIAGGMDSTIKQRVRVVLAGIADEVIEEVAEDITKDLSAYIRAWHHVEEDKIQVTLIINNKEVNDDQITSYPGI